MTFYKINQLAKEDNQKKTLNQGQIKRRNMSFFFGPCIFIIEGRTDQRNAQINFSLINLLLFKLLRHVSAT